MTLPKGNGTLTANRLYGLRVADSRDHRGTFRVVCGKHKVLGDDLDIAQARALLAHHLRAHEEELSPTATVSQD